MRGGSRIRREQPILAGIDAIARRPEQRLNFRPVDAGGGGNVFFFSDAPRPRRFFLPFFQSFANEQDFSVALDQSRTVAKPKKLNLFFTDLSSQHHRRTGRLPSLADGFARKAYEAPG